jgi:hypothetical protein
LVLEVVLFKGGQLRLFSSGLGYTYSMLPSVNTEKGLELSNDGILILEESRQ